MNVESILGECALDVEEKHSRSILFEDLPEDRDAYIDSDIADLVRTVNECGVTTFESCSGTFSDHYDVESLRDEVSFGEVSSWMTRNDYVSTRLPWAFLSTAPFMHSFQDDGSVVIEDADEFYVYFPSELSVQPNDLTEKYLSWQIDVESRYPSYAFSVPMKVHRRMLMESDSFEEFDGFQRELISGLEEAIVDYSP